MATTEANSSSSIPKSTKQSQVPAGFPTSPNGDIKMMFPIMCPAFVPGLIPMQNQEQQTNLGAGLYAVPTFPFMPPMSGIPSNTLIPLTYTVPTRRTTAEGGAMTDEHGQEGRQQHAPQRQVAVRRFHFAFQLDLLLILKLAAVIFVFNQDGSKQRLALLLVFAALVYFYQTGALTPLIRWLSQGMHRAAAPPQPQPPVRAENALGAARPDGENAVRADGLQWQHVA
ncbi:hypothetical protein IFM89_011409 [Coptis chinensis]|uniref:Transmembrane protein n=1 Tax=Coptis chinensis TaxID=261450 RepID=A0A835HLV6_9MAGN|nr:hypothetical protein IFM89_011409 [Coptis chinensis]